MVSAATYLRINSHSGQMKGNSRTHTFSKSSVSSFRPSLIADDILEDGLEDNSDGPEDVFRPDGVVWKGTSYEM